MEYYKKKSGKYYRGYYSRRFNQSASTVMPIKIDENELILIKTKSSYLPSSLYICKDDFNYNNFVRNPNLLSNIDFDVFDLSVIFSTEEISHLKFLQKLIKE